MPARSIAVHAVVTAWVAVLAGPCCGQLRADPALWTATRDSIKVHADEVVDLHTTDSNKPIDPYAYKRGLFSSMGLYEYKRIGETPGQYAKPHYAVGLHSEAMREALSLTGLDAEYCIAPMVRLRAREASVTGANGISMTVFARCTFH
jgi:hypothetical protein